MSGSGPGRHHSLGPDTYVNMSRGGHWGVYSPVEYRSGGR